MSEQRARPRGAHMSATRHPLGLLHFAYDGGKICTANPDGTIPRHSLRGTDVEMAAVSQANLASKLYEAMERLKEMPTDETNHGDQS